MSDPEQSSYQKFMLNDDDTPGAFVETTDSGNCLEDHRIRNLQRRLTLQGFLLFCLVAVAVSAVYFHLKAREDTFRQTLVMRSFQSFQKLEENFQTLSAKYETLHTGLNEKFPSLNKIAETLKTDVEKTRQTLQNLDKDLKAEQKERIQSLQELEKKFATLSKEFKQLQVKSASQDTRIEQSLMQIDKTVSREIESSLDEVKTGIHKLHQSMNATRKTVVETQSSMDLFKTDLKEKVSKKELEIAVQSGQQTFRKELNTLLKRMIHKEKRLMSLEEKIRQVEQSLQTDFRRKAIPSLYPGEHQQKTGIEEKKLAP